MKSKEMDRAKLMAERLVEYETNVGKLPGLKPKGHSEVLVGQLIESLRRIEFVHHIRDGDLSDSRLDPDNSIFDPLRAAVLQYRKGDYDEAYWLVFLATHFGKHAKQGWRLVREIYGKLGSGRWTWKEVTAKPGEFRAWLQTNQKNFVGRRFSNHRKFESLKAKSKKGTAVVVESYIEWVRPYGSHSAMVRELHKKVGQNPTEVFDAMYRSMDAVQRFGRLARFDFLTMLGKLGIAPIDPGSAYLWHNASGPLDGARLLFVGKVDANLPARKMDERLIELDSYLRVGMQTLEDALCNWQKSPSKFISFRG
jgi:hypothetical protein